MTRSDRCCPEPLYGRPHVLSSPLALERSRPISSVSVNLTFFPPAATPNPYSLLRRPLIFHPYSFLTYPDSWRRFYIVVSYRLSEQRYFGGGHPPSISRSSYRPLYILFGKTLAVEPHNMQRKAANMAKRTPDTRRDSLNTNGSSGSPPTPHMAAIPAQQLQQPNQFQPPMAGSPSSPIATPQANQLQPPMAGPASPPRIYTATNGTQYMEPEFYHLLCRARRAKVLGKLKPSNEQEFHKMLGQYSTPPRAPTQTGVTSQAQASMHAGAVVQNGIPGMTPQMVAAMRAQQFHAMQSRLAQNSSTAMSPQMMSAMQAQPIGMSNGAPQNGNQAMMPQMIAAMQPQQMIALPNGNFNPNISPQAMGAIPAQQMGRPNGAAQNGYPAMSPQMMVPMQSQHMAHQNGLGGQDEKRVVYIGGRPLILEEGQQLVSHNGRQILLQSGQSVGLSPAQRKALQTRQQLPVQNSQQHDSPAPAQNTQGQSPPHLTQQGATRPTTAQDRRRTSSAQQKEEAKLKATQKKRVATVQSAAAMPPPSRPASAAGKGKTSDPDMIILGSKRKRKQEPVPQAPDSDGAGRSSIPTAVHVAQPLQPLPSNLHLHAQKHGVRLCDVELNGSIQANQNEWLSRQHDIRIAMSLLDPSPEIIQDVRHNVARQQSNAPTFFAEPTITRAKKKVRRLDYDFTTSEHPGQHLEPATADTSAMCTRDEDGSLRAPEPAMMSEQRADLLHCLQSLATSA
jgi:hypothetical protein